MSYYKRYLQAVLSTGLILGLFLNASVFHPLQALFLVLLAILPALIIPHLLLADTPKPEEVL
jgi:hypothetical protein